MENAYKMRITCNPYTKEIVYECCENDSFVNISELSAEYSSELINDKFTKTSFQNRAYEIVELLNKHFNPGNKGLHIDFIGNKDDYDALESVISTYFADCNIVSEKNQQYFNEAPYVMQQIETRFDDVISTLEDSEYIKDEIAAEISKYRDTIDESIAICVTGLCSAGKSAFINSLIGYEILPSSSDPTTAKMFKITCSDTYSISFEAYGQTVTVSFSNDMYTVSNNCPSEVNEEIGAVFTDEKADNEVKNMHRFLDWLNKGKLLTEIGRIDISIPFRQVTYFDSHYQFVIYDTPGSNSDSNKKHFDILRESLSKQTNALLILLTTPDTMDYTDNNNLLDLIQETGESLDTSNAIIVVNKGDILTPSSLSEKRERYQSLKITKWKSTRIFFLSSVIALASKKDDPDDKSSWIDEDAFDAYDDRCRKFARGDKILYKYNIIDKSKEVAPVVEEGAVSDTTLFINSGLASIEHEISDYALRYALCNKCSRATEYLQRAIQLCEDNVREIERKRDDELISTQTLFDEKQRTLAESLDSKQSMTASSKSVEFRQSIGQSFDGFKAQNGLVYKNFLQIRKLSIYSEFEQEWKNISALKEQQGFDMDEALRRMESKVRYRYNALLNAFSSIANALIGSFWENATATFKADCKAIITDSDVLNDEQKAIMNSILLNMENMTRAVVEFDLRSIHAVKRTFFGKDQAPDMLDEAVIRNTNTKIIFRLPDENDCELVGKSIALTEVQIKELAKLPAFVAVIHQNDWIEAVLCKSEKYDKERKYAFSKKESNISVYHLMLNIYGVSEKIALSDEEKAEVLNWINRLENGDNTKRILRKGLANEAINEEEKVIIAYNVFGGQRTAMLLRNAENNEVGLSRVRRSIGSVFSLDGDDKLIDIVQQYVCTAINREEACADIARRYQYFGMNGGIM